MHNSPRKIAVILPALNEEKALFQLIREVPKLTLEGKGYEVEIVVVDNNSTDNTSSVAREMGARVIFVPKRGKGRAIIAAFAQVDADFCFMLDSDYTYPPSHIIEMVEVLEHKDVVIGSRIKGRRERGSMKWPNYMGNLLLSAMASAFYGNKISDLCTGYWGFRGHVARNINLEGVYGFELETRLFIQIVKQGYSYKEVPVNYRRRVGTRAKLNLFKDGFKIAMSLLKHRHDLPRTESRK
jgi:dolichol-phosphate hexosyltransferase